MKKFTKCLIISLSSAMFIGGFTVCTKSALKSNKNTQSKLSFGELVGDYKLDTSVNFGNTVLKIESSKLIDKEVTVIVEMEGTTQIDSYNNDKHTGDLLEFTNSSKGIEINNKLVASQANLVKKLSDKKLITDVNSNYTVLMNGFSVQAKYGDLEDIKSVKGVKNAYVANLYATPVVEAKEIKDEPPGENTDNREYPIDSGLLQNDTEYQGEGMIVAVLDTGVDYNHEAFSVAPTNPKYTKDDIAQIIDKSAAKRVFKGKKELTADDVYKSAKIPFQFDYTDRDADALPIEADHGTHVSGITCGYTADGSFKGVAPQAQLAFMKVFSDYESNARDDVILNALEDCALLDVDVINESLGSYCGYSQESELDEEKGEINKKMNQIYKTLYEQGVSVNVSAGNDYFQSYGAPDGSNLITNPDSGNVGSPGTYTTALCVASVESKKAPYVEANGNFKMSIVNAFDTNSREYDFIKMVLEKKNISDDSIAEVEYVTVPNLGGKGDYVDLDVKGKIALVKRGTLSFEDKIANAAEAGAIGIVIYNNTSGTIRMSCGDNVKIPACSISNAAGMELIKKANGTLRMSNAFLAEPIMSDFSSLGPAPDLSLKPEVTSCGGDVYSSIIGNRYARYSGTSMSCPNLSGMSIAIREYVQENWTSITGEDLSTMTKKRVMFLCNQIISSTTELCLDEYGNPYSPRKQGAGVASIRNALAAAAYISCDGTDKVKAELKDDKNKTGVYTIDFNVTNYSNVAKTYDVSNITETETTDADGKTVGLMAKVINPNMTVKVNGVLNNNTKITLSSHETVKVTVTLTLTEEEKEYIDSKFPNGMYVEGFIQLTCEEDNTHLGIPFLAFYGDWLDAPIWDKTYYEIQCDELYTEGWEEKDRLHAAMSASTPFGHYGDIYIVQLGSYAYDQEDYETKIWASEEKAAISIYEDNAIYDFYTVQGGLLRNCEEINMVIRNAETGQIVYEKTTYNNRKDAFYQSTGGTLPWVEDYSLNPFELSLANNAKYTVSFEAKLNYPGAETVQNNVQEFSFYVDYEEPTVQGIKYTKELDPKTNTMRYYADITFYDNRFVMSYVPCIIAGDENKGYSLQMISSNIPVDQKEAGTTTVARLDLTDYMTTITSSATPDTFYVYVDDYALNSGLYYFSLNGAEFEDLTFKDETITLSVNEVINLNDYVNYEDAMLEGFKWTCSPQSVAKIKDGEVVGLKRGVATITGTTDYGVSIKTQIKVLGPNDEGYVEQPSLPDVEKISYSSFTTLFTYTDNGYPSKIGSVGNSYSSNLSEIKMYPRESVQLNTEFSPWYHNDEDYTIDWVSSNYSVVDVDDNGIVTAQGEGSAFITAYVVKNGKRTRTRSSISITVEKGLITQGAMVMAYKGADADIFITKESGFNYISQSAFSLYDYTPTGDTFILVSIGNDFIKSIFFHPEVEMIGQGAMEKLTALEKVTLPDNIQTIAPYTFNGDINLKEVIINSLTTHITSIDHYAFAGCESLPTIDLSSVYNIGDYSFMGCTSLNNIDLSKQQYAGTGSFMNCTSLTNVILSENTYIGTSMFENSGISISEIPTSYIGNRAFYNCHNLTSIHFSSNDVTIGANAFANCENLKSVTFEKGATVRIAKNAFRGTAIESLQLDDVNLIITGSTIMNDTSFNTLTLNGDTTISLNCDSAFANSINFNKVDGTSTKYTIENNIVYSKDETTLILATPNSDLTNLKSTLITIAPGALNGNKSTSLVLPSSVTTIGSFALSGSSITSIDFQNGSVTLEANAFRNATELVTLSNVIFKEVKGNAFNGTKVSELVFDNDVVIPDYAFAYMSSLNKVTFNANATIGDYAFYKAFNEEGGQIILGDSSEITIGKYAFANSNISSIDLSKAIDIDEYAFNNATKLLVADLSNVNVLKSHVFEGAEALTSVTLSNSVSVLPSYFLKGASSLQSLDLKNVTVLEEYCLSESGITSLDINKVTKINDYALAKSQLTSIDLSKGPELGKYVFASCEKLLSATLINTMEEIPVGTFYLCELLSSINLSNIKVVNDFALANCVALTSGDLSNLTTIGKYGMSGISIQELNLPKVTSIGEFGLYNAQVKVINVPSLIYLHDFALAATRIESINLPSTVEVIGSGAIYACSYLKEIKCDDKLDFQKDGKSWLLDKGVLYIVLPDNTLQVEIYPQKKADKSYVILDNTSRIEEGAFMNASFIEEVTIPASVKVIGDGAFYDTPSLTHYIFLGDAPTLECFYSSALIEYLNQLPEDSYTQQLKDMYRYSYWASGYFYSNFNDFIGVNDEQKLTITYTWGKKGYDTFVYENYFHIKDALGKPEIPDIPNPDQPEIPDNPNPDKKGCKGSLISITSTILSMSLCGIAIFLKKKKETN